MLKAFVIHANNQLERYFGGIHCILKSLMTLLAHTTPPKLEGSEEAHGRLIFHPRIKGWLQTHFLPRKLIYCRNLPQTSCPHEKVSLGCNWTIPLFPRDRHICRCAKNSAHDLTLKCPVGFEAQTLQSSWLISIWTNSSSPPYLQCLESPNQRQTFVRWDAKSPGLYQSLPNLLSKHGG